MQMFSELNLCGALADHFSFLRGLNVLNVEFNSQKGDNGFFLS